MEVYGTNDAIMDRIIHDVIETWTNEKQLSFLKIYPIFKLRTNLIDHWIKIYKTLHYKIIECRAENSSTIFKLFRPLIKLASDKPKQLPAKEEALLIKKNNAINFLEKGIINNYIKLTQQDIIKINDILEAFDKNNSISNTINFYISMNKSDRRKMKTRSVILKRNGNDEIIHDDISFEFNEITILNLNVDEFVLEITRNISEIFVNINVHEFINVAISGVHDKNTCPNISIALEEYKKFSYWIPSEILLKNHNRENMIGIVKKFVEIAYKLRKLHNYHLMFAFVSGLNLRCVQRIKFLWNPDEEHTKKFIELEQIILPLSNFINYRHEIKNVVRSLVIPFTGVIISDIKHLIECELYTCHGVRWETIDGLLKIIENFELRNGHNQINKNNRIINYINNLRICRDEELLYEKSTNVKLSQIPASAPVSVRHHNSKTDNIEPIETFRKIIDSPKQKAHHKHKSEKKDQLCENKNMTRILEAWSTDDVCNWLNTINMAEYVELFRTEDITGYSLSELTDVQLKELNINKMGDRLKLLKCIKELLA